MRAYGSCIKYYGWPGEGPTTFLHRPAQPSPTQRSRARAALRLQCCTCRPRPARITVLHIACSARTDIVRVELVLPRMFTLQLQAVYVGSARTQTCMLTSKLSVSGSSFCDCRYCSRYCTTRAVTNSAGVILIAKVHRLGKSDF